MLVVVAQGSAQPDPPPAEVSRRDTPDSRRASAEGRRASIGGTVTLPPAAGLPPAPSAPQVLLFDINADHDVALVTVAALRSQHSSCATQISLRILCAGEFRRSGCHGPLACIPASLWVFRVLA